MLLIPHLLRGGLYLLFSLPIQAKELIYSYRVDAFHDTLPRVSPAAIYI